MHSRFQQGKHASVWFTSFAKFLSKSRTVTFFFNFLVVQNHGEEISLRLRTDDLKGFRKYESIKTTLLHELVCSFLYLESFVGDVGEVSYGISFKIHFRPTWCTQNMIPISLL